MHKQSPECAQPHTHTHALQHTNDPETNQQTSRPVPKSNVRRAVKRRAHWKRKNNTRNPVTEALCSTGQRRNHVHIAGGKSARKRTRKNTEVAVRGRHSKRGFVIDKNGVYKTKQTRKEKMEEQKRIRHGKRERETRPFFRASHHHQHGRQQQ